jgi:hypothetical protein
LKRVTFHEPLIEEETVDGVTMELTPPTDPKKTVLTQDFDTIPFDSSTDTDDIDHTSGIRNIR